jgi:benzoyl-CoA reductase/2-hydroxyglutaryl-CoA dehydratase subunit BcrC/BadD/HgdB
MGVPKRIRSVCNNPASLLSEYNDSGVEVIGYTCSYIPEELIISAGIQPYRVSDIASNTSSLTPSFICPFASATLENMLENEHLFGGFVLAHTCDPMWRLYDILKKRTSKPLFLLRVPHNTDSSLSLDFFKMELSRLIRFLEKSFKAEIRPEALTNSIRLCNETRSLLKDIYMLNRAGEFKTTAVDRFQLVLASMWMPRSEYNAQVKVSDFDKDNVGSGVRLHLNGTAIYDLNLIKAVEDSGGFIVSDDLCTGSRYFWGNVKESEDPIFALGERYLNKVPCPSQTPLKERLEYINFMAKEFEAQGVITFAKRFCDPILYDTVHIRNMLDKEGIATIVIDYENPAQEMGRIKTRVEAFLESISG